MKITQPVIVRTICSCCQCQDISAKDSEKPLEIKLTPHCVDDIRFMGATVAGRVPGLPHHCPPQVTYPDILSLPQTPTNKDNSLRQTHLSSTGDTPVLHT